MQFLHPGMLWALSLVAIPIIVHLFNFRKHKTVYFPAVFFLREIKEETQQKSKIKHWIVLACRILAIIALVLAFAQPVLPGKMKQQGRKIISIYIDNSFSMENQQEGISLLELAKNKALDLVMAYGESDRFHILSNEFSGAQQHIVTKDNAIELIQQIQPSPISRGLDQVFERQKDLLSPSDVQLKKAFMISDFQKSTLAWNQWNADTAIDVRWIPVQNETVSNVFVDSIWFDIPHHSLQQPETLHVKVKNIGNEEKVGVRCEINIQDQNKGVLNLNIGASSSAVVDFVITPTQPGIQNGKIILDDQPIVFDNQFYFNYSVADKIKVGIAYEETSASQRIFNLDPQFSCMVSPIQQLDYSGYVNQTVLIAENISNPSNGWISATYEAVEKGATLILIPNADQMQNNWNNLFQKFQLGSLGNLQKASFIAKTLDFSNPIFAGVFEQKADFALPHSQSRFTMNLNAACLPLIAYEDGSPFLFHRKLGDGEVYYFNCALKGDQNNLLSHSIFPIGLLRMVERAGMDQPLYHFIDQKEPLVFKQLNLEGNDALTLEFQNNTVIPVYRNINNRLEMELTNGLQVAGNYQIKWGSQSIGSVGINYNTKESDNRVYTPEELEKEVIPNIAQEVDMIDSHIEEVGTASISMDDGVHFWWYLIILTLIFIFLETILIAVWKM